MDEETQSTATEQIKEPIKKSKGKKSLLVLLVLILMGASAGGAYWWREQTAKDFQKQQAADIASLKQTTESLKKQLADEKAKNAKSTSAPAKTACTPKAPTASVIENIKASITSGNTAALEGYMATNVDVTIAGSGAPTANTPTQAVTAITNFIGDPTTSTWDFALSASTLSSYGAGSYSKYFPSIAVVGKSGGKKVIAFSFDCNGKINTVLLAANEDILK
ncbi:hypothetical protein A3F37_00475 [Candidatus Saccharibacteria bacterium RIFCSPHIGHO2_12_FULL_41_12]|nr:MAG: hypothetical protein A3F37_00475 [Candidatus Saccharibacteria bacterium RIFCSPHIGHO2_12_FULL_41_12]